MLSYSDQSLSWLLYTINNLCRTEPDKVPQVTIRDDKIAISNKDDTGVWRVYVGIIGGEPRDFNPVYQWVAYYLSKTRIDWNDVRWRNYYRSFFTVCERDWLAKKLNIPFSTVEESIWTHELFNEYALETLFRRTPAYPNPYLKLPW